jgi:hypothetical protein
MAKPLIERFNDDVPMGKWFSLDDICDMVESSAKSYVKVQVVVSGLFEYRQVLVTQKTPRHVKNTWRWMFKRVYALQGDTQ